MRSHDPHVPEVTHSINAVQETKMHSFELDMRNDGGNGISQALIIQKMSCVKRKH